MHRRFYRSASAVGLAAATLTSCASLPRHNNTLVFFTTTSVALSIGADPTSTPKILFGYQRNEGVAMPLVADTSNDEAKDGTVVGSPCPISPTPSGTQSPCVLFGKRTSGTTEMASDIPSVLATFQGNGSAKGVSGDATKPQVTASGGIVQYFATGIAAQMLAEHGGAAAVSTAPAATAAAIASERALFAERARDPVLITAATTEITRAKVLTDQVIGAFTRKTAEVGGIAVAKLALIASVKTALGANPADALNNDLTATTDLDGATKKIRDLLRQQDSRELQKLADTFT